MSRPLGAYYGIPHGEANAMLLPTVLEYNQFVSASRYRDIAQAIGLDVLGRHDHEVAKQVVRYVAELFEQLPLKSKLREFGVSQDDIAKMAQDAYDNASAKVNPRKALYEEVVAIYRSIY
jgi:1,3-propanediol dehydrogenase/alcohol dehydrogenase